MNFLGAILVNAVGDLFFTEFKKTGLKESLASSKPKDFFTEVRIVFSNGYTIYPDIIT